MIPHKYTTDFSERSVSIIKKAVMWTCLLYIFHIFYAPQSDYISKQVSDAVISYFVFILITLFVLMGIFISIILLCGNDNDREKICRFVLDNHVALMISILIVKR